MCVNGDEQLGEVSFDTAPETCSAVLVLGVLGQFVRRAFGFSVLCFLLRTF